VRSARDVSEFVVRGSDRVSTRKPPRPDRVSNYRDTAMRNISRMSVRQAVSIRHSLWHQARAIDPVMFRPLPFIYLDSPFRLSRSPFAHRLIDATRFLRVITVALESDRFNLPFAI